MLYYYLFNCHPFSRDEGLTCLEFCNLHILLVRKPFSVRTMKTWKFELKTVHFFFHVQTIFFYEVVKRLNCASGLLSVTLVALLFSCHSYLYYEKKNFLIV